VKARGLIIDFAGVLVLLSIISVFSVVPVEAQSNSDFLVNGGFDNDLNGWNINVTINVNYIWFKNYSNRSGVVVVNSTSNFSRFDLYQIITINDNETYSISMEFFSNSSCFDCYLDIFLYSNISGIYWMKRFNIGNISGWYSYTSEVHVPVGEWELYIMVHNYDGSFQVGIDSVHLYGNDNGETDNRRTLGGFAEDVERYWYLVAYLPIALSLVFDVAYFIERKLVIRKLSKLK